MFVLMIPLYLVAVQGRLESLIALRDYDFVGEDQRLMGLLGERMELLRRTVDLADIEASIAKENTLNLPDIPPDFVPKPDLLQINLQSFPKFNVSMDYGEILNANMEVDPSLSHPDGELTFNITEPEAGRRTGNLTASRRAPVYWDPSFWHYDLKLVDLMKQNIYMVQDRFLEIQSTVEKYQSDDRFKIAYIFNRLDEWKKDIRTAFHAMSKPRHWTVKMHVRQQLLYYEHLLRKNIDITYSIEFLNHLHGSFMVKMKELIPGRGTKGKMLLKQQKDDIKAHQNAQGK